MDIPKPNTILKLINRELREQKIHTASYTHFHDPSICIYSPHHQLNAYLELKDATLTLTTHNPIATIIHQTDLTDPNSIPDLIKALRKWQSPHSPSSPKNSTTHHHD